MPPSFEALKARLQGRGTETDEVIEKRLAAAKGEMQRANEYDYIVVFVINKPKENPAFINNATHCHYLQYPTIKIV